jgi:hypothetical protein
METVQLIRDIAIIVFIATAFVVMAIVAFVALRVYGKVNRILEDVRTTARNAARISGSVAGTLASKPMLAVISALGAAGGTAFAALRLRRRKADKGEHATQEGGNGVKRNGRERWHTRPKAEA